MNILIFGATGAIGKLAVKHAKEKGYNVSVYVRNAEKVSDSSLNVIEGELTDYGKMKDAVIGKDAIIWTVGIPMKRKYDGMAALEGHKNLLRVMKENGVRRLIDWGTPSILRRKMLNHLLRFFQESLHPSCSNKQKRKWLLLENC